MRAPAITIQAMRMNTCVYTIDRSTGSTYRYCSYSLTVVLFTGWRSPRRRGPAAPSSQLIPQFEQIGILGKIGVQTTGNVMAGYWLPRLLRSYVRRLRD